METLALVMTDVEGSTRLWQDEPAAMDSAMRRHHEIVHGAVQAHGGWRPVDQGEGDSVFAAFSSVTDAVCAVVQIQFDLSAQAWPTTTPLRVRIGVHLGEVHQRDGNLFGDAVNRCARLRSLGSGGQSLISAAVYETVQDKLPEGVTARDLGQHALKDLVRPEHVRQLDLEGLPVDFPALSSPDRPTHNLPGPTAPFIGREAELELLISTLREHRLVTVTGFGGMGKTRLAVQAAAALAGDPDFGQVCFVDLAAVTDPELVPARVAEAAGIRFGSGQPARALVDAFAWRPALLLLDNLEQVIGCASFVADLVANAPAVRVLCTSREPLSVRSERQVVVEPMKLPAQTAGVTAQSLSPYEAVQLFEDRARAVRADFSVTDETAPVVAEICARLDGHPLALELAAARLRVLTPEALLGRLTTALAVLTGGPRDAPERQKTLRATIAWSFDALTAPEQLLLTRLSVLAGPADLELVEAVCGHDLDVLDVLDVLVQRSLVRTVGSAGHNRFGLLVSVREFAAEKLLQNDADQLQDRLVHHLLAVFAAVRDPYGTSAAFAQRASHVRAALSHLHRTGQSAREVELVIALDDGVAQSGHYAEALALTERSLSLTDDPTQEASLYRARATTYNALGATELMRQANQHGLRAARASGHAALHANMVAVALGGARDLPEIEQLQLEYAGLREQLSESDGREFDEQIANILAGHFRGLDPDRAEEQARRFAFAPERHAHHRVRLARVLFDTGRVEEGWAVLQPTRAPDAFGGLRGWEVLGDIELARGLLLRGESTQAHELASASLHEQTLFGVVPHVAAALVGQLEQRAGDLPAAHKALDGAVTQAPEPSELPAATLLWRRALVHHLLGDSARAEDDLRQAASVLAGLPLQVLELLGCLATGAVTANAPERAATLLGCVQAHRSSWVLPQDLDDLLSPLGTALAASHPDALDAGRLLSPLQAAGLLP